MITAAALLLVLEATGVSKSPPLPPVMSPETERRFLAALPLISVDGHPFRVFAIRATGDRGLLQRAAKKLSSEGWQCKVLTDHTGTLILGVFAHDKTLADVQQVESRFAAGEFGPIHAAPMLLPDSDDAQ